MTKIKQPTVNFECWTFGLLDMAYRFKFVLSLSCNDNKLSLILYRALKTCSNKKRARLDNICISFVCWVQRKVLE